VLIHLPASEPKGQKLGEFVEFSLLQEDGAIFLGYDLLLGTNMSLLGSINL
jgi:hypothetical protein